MYVDVCLRLMEFQEDISFNYEPKDAGKLKRQHPGAGESLKGVHTEHAVQGTLFRELEEDDKDCGLLSWEPLM